MVLYIISQILVGCGIFVDILSKSMKSKVLIILFMVCANVFYISSYICLQSPLAAITNALYLLRGLIVLYLDKKNKSLGLYILMFISVVGSVALTLGFLWRSPLDLFVLFATICSTAGLIFKKTLFVRLGLAGQCVLWIFYNFFLQGYVNMAGSTVNLLAAIGAIIYYNALLQKKQDSDNAKVEKMIKIIKDNRI